MSIRSESILTSALRGASLLAMMVTAVAMSDTASARATDASASPQASRAESVAQNEDGDIIVTGKYTIDNKIDTATGLGLTVQETPQSVSIITSQRILDQNLISGAVSHQAE